MDVHISREDVESFVEIVHLNHNTAGDYCAEYVGA